MFVGCFEVSISVIVKHVRDVGIIRAFCLPGGTYSVFHCLGGQKKNAGFWFAKGDQYPGRHYMGFCDPKVSTKV